MLRFIKCIRVTENLISKTLDKIFGIKKYQRKSQTTYLEFLTAKETSYT